LGAQPLFQDSIVADGVSENERVPDFAPDDPTDGRALLEWASKYPPQAKRAIALEAVYLAILLFVIPMLLLLVWLEHPRAWLGLSDARYRSLMKYLLAWLSGSFGGTLFDVKWLYHTVARKLWNIDRRLWRLFTPHISGGLAFAVVALISSGMLRIFDRNALTSSSTVVAIGFMVGYFSDSAVAKLSEVADTLFGATRKLESKDKPPD
jgi:hypothetical protein